MMAWEGGLVSGGFSLYNYSEEMVIIFSLVFPSQPSIWYKGCIRRRMNSGGRMDEKKNGWIFHSSPRMFDKI